MNRWNIRALGVLTVVAGAAFSCASSTTESPAPRSVATPSLNVEGQRAYISDDFVTTDESPTNAATETTSGPEHPLPSDPLAPEVTPSALPPPTFAGGVPQRAPLPHDSINHRTPFVGIEPVDRSR